MPHDHHDHDHAQSRPRRTTTSTSSPTPCAVPACAGAAAEAAGVAGAGCAAAAIRTAILLCPPRGAGARLRSHAPTRRDERRPLAPEPRVGLPAPPNARRRRPGRVVRRRRESHLHPDRRRTVPRPRRPSSRGRPQARRRTRSARSESPSDSWPARPSSWPEPVTPHRSSGASPSSRRRARTCTRSWPRTDGAARYSAGTGHDDDHHRHPTRWCCPRHQADHRNRRSDQDVSREQTSGRSTD